MTVARVLATVTVYSENPPRRLKTKWVDKSWALKLLGCLAVPVRQSLALLFFCSTGIVLIFYLIFDNILHGYIDRIHPSLPTSPDILCYVFLLPSCLLVHLAPAVIATAPGGLTSHRSRARAAMSPVPSPNSYILYVTSAMVFPEPFRG